MTGYAPRREWTEAEQAAALAAVYKVLLRRAEEDGSLTLAYAIDAARDAIQAAQGEPRDVVLEHAKRAALAYVNEADAERIAARLLENEE